MQKPNELPRTSQSYTESDQDTFPNNNTQTYLRIPKSLVCLPDYPYDLSNDSTRHLYLLSGETTAFSQYAGTTVDWLINLARLMCEPRCDGRLFTHPTDSTLPSWYDLDRTSAWTPVAPGDPLRSAIYEFCPTGTNVVLSQISRRQQHSLTESDNRDQSRNFQDEVFKRDGSCVVSKLVVGSVASHLVPKRMGDAQTKELVERFCGEAASQGIFSFHPAVGVTTLLGLDRLINMYLAGFYHLQEDTYEAHNFHEVLNLTAMGHETTEECVGPLLHRRIFTLTPQPDSAGLPPPGVFMWHYMQCAIARFGTPEYKNLSQVWHYEHPFRTSEDSEEEYGDDEEIPPWPLYHMDMAGAKEEKRQTLVEQKKSIGQWASRVS